MGYTKCGVCSGGVVMHNTLRARFIPPIITEMQPAVT